MGRAAGLGADLHQGGKFPVVARQVSQRIGIQCLEQAVEGLGQYAIQAAGRCDAARVFFGRETLDNRGIPFAGANDATQTNFIRLPRQPDAAAFAANRIDESGSG